MRRKNGFTIVFFGMLAGFFSLSSCYAPLCEVYLQAYNAQDKVIDDRSSIKFYCLTSKEFVARNGMACSDMNQLDDCSPKPLLAKLKRYRIGKNEIPPNEYHLFAVRYRGDTPQIVGYRYTIIQHSGDTIKIRCHF